MEKKTWWETIAWTAVVLLSILCMLAKHRFDVIPFAVAIIGLAGLFLSYNSDKPRGRSHTELRRGVLLTILLFIAIMIPMHMGQPSLMTDFYHPKIEWLASIVFAIGGAGALWAIFAKSEASKAFTEAKMAKEIGETIYKAIAGPFEFRDILKPNVDYMLPYHLDREKSDLILFLGFPAVGLLLKKPVKLSNGQSVEVRLFTDALNFCDQLTNRLNQFARIEKERKPEIELLTWRLVCFSKDCTKRFLDAAKHITPQQAEAYQKAEALLHESAAALAAQWPDNFSYAFLEMEIGIRFAISASRDPNRPTEEKAAVWVVSDFSAAPGAEDVAAFESVRFKSQDPQIIKVLRQLCEDTIKYHQPGLVTVLKNTTHATSPIVTPPSSQPEAPTVPLPTAPTPLPVLQPPAPQPMTTGAAASGTPAAPDQE